MTHGWEKWIGDHGVAVGVDTFGASAPDKALFEHSGMTVANVVAQAHKSLSAV